MAYGVRYYWQGWNGKGDSAEATAIFESKEEMLSWVDGLTGSMQDRLEIVGEGEISSDLEDTLQFIREEIPDNEPEEEDEET